MSQPLEKNAFMKELTKKCSSSMGYRVWFFRVFRNNHFASMQIQKLFNKQPKNLNSQIETYSLDVKTKIYDARLVVKHEGWSGSIWNHG